MRQSPWSGYPGIVTAPGRPAGLPGLHGYAIMTAIKEMSEDVLRPEEGSLYPALHRMEEAGWVKATWVTKETGRRARMYEMTREGAQQLEAEESRWQAVTMAVNRVLRMA